MSDYEYALYTIETTLELTNLTEAERERLADFITRLAYRTEYDTAHEAFDDVAYDMHCDSLPEDTDNA